MYLYVMTYYDVLMTCYDVLTLCTYDVLWIRHRSWIGIPLSSDGEAFLKKPLVRLLYRPWGGKWVSPLKNTGPCTDLVREHQNLLEP